MFCLFIGILILEHFLSILFQLCPYWTGILYILHLRIYLRKRKLIIYSMIKNLEMKEEKKNYWIGNIRFSDLINVRWQEIPFLSYIFQIVNNELFFLSKKGLIKIHLLQLRCNSPWIDIEESLGWSYSAVSFNTSSCDLFTWLNLFFFLSGKFSF